MFRFFFLFFSLSPPSACGDDLKSRLAPHSDTTRRYAAYDHYRALSNLDLIKKDIDLQETLSIHNLRSGWLVAVLSEMFRGVEASEFL